MAELYATSSHTILDTRPLERWQGLLWNRARGGSMGRPEKSLRGKAKMRQNGVRTDEVAWNEDAKGRSLSVQSVAIFSPAVISILPGESA